MSLKKVSLLTLLFAISLSIAAPAADAADPLMGLSVGIPQLSVPKPQGFCGYCHILTYPEIVNKAYETWRKGKHNKVGCVECHYEPQAKGAPSPVSAQPPDAVESHIPNAPPAHFSYIPLGGKTFSTQPKISDAGCMTASCHGKPDDPFQTKKIKFTEKVSFIHKPHFEKEKQIEGMKINCTTCHQRETEAKHFQVSEATCHLCHFANTKFNEGRARCELCHQLPTEPIQTVEDPNRKPITHQMLKEAGVSCSSCHIDLLQGSVKTKVEPVFKEGVIRTVLSLGVARLKKENCRVCHDQTAYLKKADDKKEMHQTHVTVKNAVCFDCHRPILHRKNKGNQPMPGDCGACHQDPHQYQRFLVAGQEREGIPAMPDPMYKARTNCLACHIEKEINHRGQQVMGASVKACVQCHTKDYEQMFGLWKREIAGEVDKAERLEKEALAALAKYKTTVAEDKWKEANRMIQSGSEKLRIVRFGNGIHNSKYAIALLDAAETSFKDSIGYLEGKDMSESAIQYE